MTDVPSTRLPTETATAAPPAPPAPAPAPEPARSPASRVLLFVTAALFISWMCWLGYTALTRSQSPVVSHAQAASAKLPVVAELIDGEGGQPALRVKVVEAWKGGPEKGSAFEVPNLPDCAGYTGPGTYLLLLNPDPDAPFAPRPAFLVAGVHGPGAATADGGARIYLWNEKTSPGLRAQIEKLFP